MASRSDVINHYGDTGSIQQAGVSTKRSSSSYVRPFDDYNDYEDDLTEKRRDRRSSDQNEMLEDVDFDSRDSRSASDVGLQDTTGQPNGYRSSINADVSTLF